MKKLIAILLFILTVTTVHAQYSSTQHRQNATSGSGFRFDKSKLTFGGGIGLQFGSYTLVNVAPQIGYNFTKNLNAGAGFTYTYWKDDYHINGVKYKESNNYLGFNLYGKYYPIQNIVLLVQPEINRAWNKMENTSNGYEDTDERFVPAVLIGGGVRFGPMTLMLQYDLVQDDYSPYGNSIFYGVGYTFSF